MTDNGSEPVTGKWIKKRKDVETVHNPAGTRYKKRVGPH